MKEDMTKNIIESLPRGKSFTAKDILEAIKDKTGSLPPMATIQWRLHDLRNKQIIERVSRGVYQLNNKRSFQFDINERVNQINILIKQRFPFIKYCIWSGISLSSLMHHIAVNNSIYVEAERDAVESVFNVLKETYSDVFINPDNTLMERYVDLSENSIIVRTLVSEAPLNRIDGIPTPSFEKILVDICFDNDFQYLSESESFKVIDNARQYSIDSSRLLRYAARKNRREQMQILISNH